MTEIEFVLRDLQNALEMRKKTLIRKKPQLSRQGMYVEGQLCELTFTLKLIERLLEHEREHRVSGENYTL